MKTERHVRLFSNGRNQAIRIPRESELDADSTVKSIRTGFASASHPLA